MENRINEFFNQINVNITDPLIKEITFFQSRKMNILNSFLSMQNSAPLATDKIPHSIESISTKSFNESTAVVEKEL